MTAPHPSRWDGGVHTCSDDCPCHTGGTPTPDFVGDPMPRSMTRMKAVTDPSWAIDRIIALEVEREELRQENNALLAALTRKETK